MESPSLGVFKERLDVVLGDMVQWVTLVVRGWLDQMISEVCSNPNDSVILSAPCSASLLLGLPGESKHICSGLSVVIPAQKYLAFFSSCDCWKNLIEFVNQ